MSSLRVGPASYPRNLRVKSIKKDQVTVSWSMLPCHHQNGLLTGYKLFVREVLTHFTSGSIIVSAGHLQTPILYKVTDLRPATVYRVSVAAMNTAATGELSPEVTFLTTGGKTYYNLSDQCMNKHFTESSWNKCHAGIPAHAYFATSSGSFNSLV